MRPGGGTMAKAPRGVPPLKLGVAGRKHEVKALQQLLLDAGFNPGAAGRERNDDAHRLRRPVLRRAAAPRKAARRRTGTISSRASSWRAFLWPPPAVGQGVNNDVGARDVLT